ncbi:hypothetical protein KCM76_22815 [Zooshikella marina]|uniref:hypothetical protein n=1 Tax=Zooshikella ganghwensis TaxID=202772 RepID=UPI001BB063D1|nr:hypothetical protein [Zooshikella ganghwensis]MBU2708844.1 hypothetical protein [Zooshikella ganghwensis]
MSDSITRFSAHIAQINQGELDDELTEKLTKAVKKAMADAVSCELTLKLKIKPVNNAKIELNPSITLKVPELKPKNIQFYPTGDGDLLVDDPKQPTLDFNVTPLR